jgi:uncharacterized protein
MPPRIEQHREELARICAQRRVSRLELFGSAVRDDFDAVRSDLDFLVEFHPLREGEHADAYFGLLEDLERLYRRPIDLVMMTAVKNPYFLQAIKPQRMLLYAA